MSELLGGSTEGTQPVSKWQQRWQELEGEMPAVELTDKDIEDVTLEVLANITFTDESAADSADELVDLYAEMLQEPETLRARCC